MTQIEPNMTKIEPNDQNSDEYDEIAPIKFKFQRPLTTILLIVLIMLVVFLGYARGVLQVCKELGGELTSDKLISCRPYKPIPTENNTTFNMSIDLNELT